MVHHLPSGISIRIRPPRPDGTERLAQAIRELSPRSRRMRFLSDRSDYTPEELAPFLQPDGQALITWVAGLLDEAGNEVDQIAIGHVVRSLVDSDSGDVALVVCDRFQSHGVGKSMIDALAMSSKRAGIRRWEGVCAGENQAALNLLRKAGAMTSLTCAEGTCEFVVELF